MATAIQPPLPHLKPGQLLAISLLVNPAVMVLTTAVAVVVVVVIALPPQLQAKIGATTVVQKARALNLD
jgi:hypothetical protein